MTTDSNHPPKPHFALAIGIVGHKPDRLPEKSNEKYDKVETEVLHVLKEIKREARIVCDRYYAFFADESQSSLILSLVTALADGADTIAARAARSCGYAMDAVLPFEQENYEKDFESCALEEFRHFYGQARSTLALPGRRKLPPQRDDPDANKAYEASGLTVMGNSDVLLTVWDGGESGGRGGTTEMLVAAANFGIPIIHVDANGTHPTRILWSGLDKLLVQTERLDSLPAKPFDEALSRLIDELVRPPDAAAERKGLLRHFKEKSRRWNFFLAFPIIMTLFWVRFPTSTHWRPDSPDALSKELLKQLQPTVGEDSPPSSLIQAYAWADAVGLYFAQVFRSAFVTNFFVASFAVAAALTSLLTARLWPDARLWPVGVEIFLIFFVVLNTWIGRHYGWHNRWVEPREVAERLRVACMLWILGTRPRAFSGEEPAWTGWYARALVRVEPLRSYRFDRANLDGARTATINILQDQCSYHEASARRMKRLERHLEGVGLFFFILTVFVAIVHLFAHGTVIRCILEHLSIEEGLAHDMGILLSAVLPALATASYGIRLIGDFEGVAKRSERAHESLKAHIAALRQDPPDLDVLRRRARAAGEAMLGDLSSWRLAVESRELAIPG
jgi:hypothetical protein